VYFLLASSLLSQATASSAQAPAQVTQPPAQENAANSVRLEADTQRREGNVFVAEGNVHVLHENRSMRADYAEYDSATGDVRLRGNVKFDSETQHIEAAQGDYNVKTGQGTFTNVRGSVQMPRLPNANVLVSSNPLYFEAEEIRRLGERTYEFRDAWLTICLPEQPLWKFFAARATLHVDDKIALVHANFRLFRIPLLYAPYASLPAGRRVRQSGFTIPEVANFSNKGLVIGDSFYWAPADWMDLEVGAEYYSKRGWSQSGTFRARPSERSYVQYTYFGVQDRGLPDANGIRVPQGGHQWRAFGETTLGDGWRAVADVNQLSSLTFRLAFASTYSGATVSEIPSVGFVTKHFRGFSLNFSALNYRDFLSTAPDDRVVLRRAPEVRFSSVEQPLSRRLPIYFGLDSYVGGNHRSDPLLDTPELVERSEIAPRVTVPLNWTPWIGVTASVTGRATHYGAQIDLGDAVAQGLTRTTGEFTAEIKAPSVERAWQAGATRWKHSIEPEIVYNYVTGVRDFSRIIRFDQRDTITDTNEVEYGLTQRLLRRPAQGSAEQFVSWRLTQKHYFDPTFGGALAPGQRNVFKALISVTPFAFADSARRWSPLVSDIKITPGGRYDFGFLANYDFVSGNMTAVGTTANIRPYRESFLTFSHFDVRTPLQPKFNQLGMRAGWGYMNRKGWNFATAMAYDLSQQYLQYQAFQGSYNGSCCGISFEYRRLALGPVRSENQFRVALLIANLGTFGTLRRQESLF
jgi:LPS-assembly protein